MNYLLDKIIDSCLAARSFFDQSPFGKESQVYWVRRNQIFPGFDSGFRTDAVGLFSATPKTIADEIAESVHAETIVDAFCGIGCTAIAFARAGKKVITADLDANRLAMARHNAALLNTNKDIEFITADIFTVIGTKKADAIFLDPPWGGVGYEKIVNFKLTNFELDCTKLLEESFKNYSKVILRVPRQFDFRELEKFAKKYTVQENKIRSKVYSKTVYFE